MTLKERFEDIDVTFDDQTSYLKYDECNEAVSGCIKIADDYAIEFAEWVTETRLYNEEVYSMNNTEELLEIFKKEQKWK